ncbi:MAG: GH3 auxin-responsive promoter family protein [Candidatus Thorarchaeota archaeon]
MGLLRRIIPLYAKRKCKHVQRILSQPIEIMVATLKEILKHQEKTVIGRKYDFAGISSPEDYASKVPLSTFDTMKPYLEATYEDPSGGILTKEPVFWYLCTSGSTGKPKHLPVTEALAEVYTKGSMQILLPYLNVHPDNPKVFDGKFIVFAAPAQTDEINGVPLGYATGAFSRRAIGILKKLMKPGEDVFNISDMESKMQVYAKVAATENVTAIQGITTLSLALIRRMQNEYGSWLLDEFKGTKHEVRLRKAMQDDGKLDMAKLWPNLRLFFCGGIDTDPYRSWINKTIPQATIWEAYGGTEGVYGGQTMIEPGVQLFPNTNYLEFIPENEVDKDEPTVIPLADVKKGYKYEMIITNIGGYYRYRLGDVMTFTSTNPYTVKGISRKGRIISLSGEKVSESDVTHSIAVACHKTGAEVMDFSVIAEIDEEKGIPHYTVAAMFKDDNFSPIEFVHAYEDALKEYNIAYKVVKEMGGLGPTSLVRMKKSLFEDIVQRSHIQAKPLPLTLDTMILKRCQAVNEGA